MPLLPIEIAAFTHEHSPLMRDAVQIYCEVWQRSSPEAQAYFCTQAQYPHFYGMVAYQDEKPVAMAFGNQSLPGQWWHDRVAARIGSIHPMLQDAWLLSELAVLPTYQNNQIGSSLHNRLIQQLTFSTLLLTTQVTNRGAQRFYERHDWRVLHHGFAFYAGHNPYRVLYRQSQNVSSFLKYANE